MSAFTKAWDFLKNNTTPYPSPAPPSSDYSIDMGGDSASGYSPYTMDTGPSVRDKAVPKGAKDTYEVDDGPWYDMSDEYQSFEQGVRDAGNWVGDKLSNLNPF